MDTLDRVIAATAAGSFIRDVEGEPLLRLIDLKGTSVDRLRVEAFQRAVMSYLGIDLEVIGGGYGCFKIEFRAKDSAGAGRFAATFAAELARVAKDPKVLKTAKELDFHLLIIEGQGEDERIDLRLHEIPDQTVDFTILTALRTPEFEAIRDELGMIATNTRQAQSGTVTFYEYTVPSPAAHEPYLVRATFLPEMGNAPAASITAKLLLEWKPRFIMLVGIGASLAHDEVKLGHVVVARNVYNYDDRRKETDDGTELAPLGYPTDRLLLSRAEALLLQERLMRKWRTRNKCVVRGRRHLPSVHIGDVASGNAVIDSARFKRGLLAHNRKLIALEMDSAGFLEAAINQEQVAKAIVIRGISDFAERKSQTDRAQKGVWRENAAKAAASFATLFMQNFPAPTTNQPLTVDTASASAGTQNARMSMTVEQVEHTDAIIGKPEAAVRD